MDANAGKRYSLLGANLDFDSSGHGKIILSADWRTLRLQIHTDYSNLMAWALRTINYSGGQADAK
jgi:hypothetical protein